jgi:hypothetical protein
VRRVTTSVVWQHANVTGPSYRVPSGGGVITSWTTGGGPSDGLRARLEMVREGASSPVVVGEGNLETGVPQLNPYTFPARIPAQGEDTLGLETDSSLASICTPSTGSVGDVLDGGLDPGPGNAFASLGTPDQGVLNVAASVEPDADHDGFGDESQDSCPSEVAVHSGPCQSGATRVGQTFQPTTPCDRGTYAPGAVPTGTSYAVQASGVLTSWDVQGPPAPHDDQIDFKVFRPTGPPHTYQAIAQGGLQTISGPGLHSFPFRLSVQTGDVIGFYSDSNSGWCGDFVRGAQHDFVDTVERPARADDGLHPRAGLQLPRRHRGNDRTRSRRRRLRRHHPGPVPNRSVAAVRLPRPACHSDPAGDSGPAGHGGFDLQGEPVGAHLARRRATSGDQPHTPSAGRNHVQVHARQSGHRAVRLQREEARAEGGR